MTIDETKFNDFVELKALEVAIANNGQANPKAILGRCFPVFPEIKSDIPKYSKTIAQITAKVNELSEEEQKEKIMELNPEFSTKKEKKVIPKSDGLPVMDIKEGESVIVRFPPAPSGHLHLGHLFGIVANYEFKKKYNGKFVLRFEDTNPENIDISNYEKIIEDVNWVCDNGVDEVCYQSDRLEIYHKYLRNLVEIGQAFVCECESEVFKAFTDASEECPHRNIEHSKMMEMFDKFMSTDKNNQYKPGTVVIRAMADLQNKNPALRTFPLARIIEGNHARIGNKHRVWPNYNMAVAVDDSLMKMSHVIRGKDLEIGEFRQEMLMKSLGLHKPQYFHYGRMKFTDLELSKSKLTQKIEDGEFEGWDDPRVPSILSHRKRGYKAEAFRKSILQMGISKRDSKITKDEYYKGLDFFNKQIIEKESNRYFSIINPATVEIENITDIEFDEFTIQKHPENPAKGLRHIQTIDKYLIEKQDFEKLQVGTKMRLMHFANFEILSKDDENKTVKLKYISRDYDKSMGIKANIHFVSANPNETEDITIIDSENNTILATSEKIEKYQIGDSIQFERYGFLRLDLIDEDGEKVFYFTHK
ncbi:MAG: glutamate--tRNA ligase [Nanoarchaeales archaeon]|nr:glutamate--tRNA ligase [Nanoarchaeales archaeon]